MYNKNCTDSHLGAHTEKEANDIPSRASKVDVDPEALYLIRHSLSMS